MDNRSLERGIFLILGANLINLVISLLTNFVLPKYLSVESYAYIKTYQLYLNYIGILHLGFADGLYLKYGGKSKKDIVSVDLASELSTIRIFQMLVSLGAIVFAFIFKDKVLMVIALSILPYNMANCFKGVCQATGDFKFYSLIIKANTLMLFCVNIVLLILRNDNYFIYISCYCVVYIVVWLILEESFRRKILGSVKLYRSFLPRVFFTNIKNGMFLMLGNFCSLIMVGMDRWFVKVLMNTTAFAQYSFSVSMVSFLNYAVTPVTTTLYNYFCQGRTNNEIVNVRRMILLFSSALISCAYPAKFILDVYLPKYIEAADSLFILFAAQLFFIIVQSIYTNLYKAQKRQREYFIKLCLVVVVGVILNWLCFEVYPVKEAFAIGTLLSAMFWLVLCQIDFNNVSMKFNEIIYMILTIGVFLCAGYLLGAISGCIVYCVTVVFCARIFMHKEFKQIICLLKMLMRKKIRM
ncbi:MAG: hypothetical protein RR568_02770 [Anaerorhabdus sp.]|uniref:lipopolysaccharide biosynthesis protein n=1 Tax=Anaerorhabdus sp. TaxID=1872524 RepID=UPI002FCCA7E1